MSIIITIIGNITVFVSYNAICFGFFMPMSHGINKEASPVVSPAPQPLTRFSPGFFVVLQEILYQHFTLVRLLQNNSFSKEINFFSQLIAGRF